MNDTSCGISPETPFLLTTFIALFAISGCFLRNFPSYLSDSGRQNFPLGKAPAIQQMEISILLNVD